MDQSPTAAAAADVAATDHGGRAGSATGRGWGAELAYSSTNCWRRTSRVRPSAVRHSVHPFDAVPVTADAAFDSDANGDACPSTISRPSGAPSAPPPGPPGAAGTTRSPPAPPSPSAAAQPAVPAEPRSAPRRSTAAGGALRNGIDRQSDVKLNGGNRTSYVASRLQSRAFEHPPNPSRGQVRRTSSGQLKRYRGFGLFRTTLVSGGAARPGGLRSRHASSSPSDPGGSGPDRDRPRRPPAGWVWACCTPTARRP
ncbi:hypothetical protein SRIMM317S_03080 [Streptomyces rimosus subsp. rimosus]